MASSDAPHVLPVAPAIGGLRLAAQSVLRFSRRKPLGAIGGGIILVFILVAIFAPLLAPYDPYQIDPANILKAPDRINWMGTDEFGRDIMSRIIWGSRISLVVGISSVVLGTTTGALVGLVSGYVGGKVDDVIQRIVDTLMAFPMLILALAMVAALGPSIGNVILALSIVILPNSARVIRSAALSVREKPFVEAARNLGFSDSRIILRHVLPNCAAPYIILATAGLGGAILAEASLSFLGLGAPPPEPSWGAMLSGQTQSYMKIAPWLAIFPGIAISIVIFGFSFLGDALRDVLDPRLRSL